jgi:hypothetical protein
MIFSPLRRLSKLSNGQNFHGRFSKNLQQINSRHIRKHAAMGNTFKMIIYFVKVTFVPIKRIISISVKNDRIQ